MEGYVMELKEYMTPEMEIITVDNTDVIITSFIGGGEDLDPWGF